MIEMLVGGFMLTGSVCVIDGAQHRNCRPVPEIQFGNQYVCARRVESILESVPYLHAEQLGFSEGERLWVEVRCDPTNGRA